VVGGFLGAFAGVALGSAAGVHLAGKCLGEPNNFRGALLGSAGGLGAFLLLISPAALDPDEVPFWVALVGLPSVGAVLSQRGVVSEAGPDASSSLSRRIGARLTPRIDGSISIVGSVEF
jgi:peptidoglycan/LPS O-acetylase OafA/YrhL